MFIFYWRFLANVQRIQRGPKFLELHTRNWKTSHAQITRYTKNYPLEGDNFLAKRQPFCGVVPRKKNDSPLGRTRPRNRFLRGSKETYPTWQEDLALDFVERLFSPSAVVISNLMIMMLIKIWVYPRINIVALNQLRKEERMRGIPRETCFQRVRRKASP